MFFSRRSNAAKRACIRQVVVVEDDALLAFDHEHTLVAAGFGVAATVNSGEAALAALSDHKVDAVILDLHIAGRISGAEIAQNAHARGIIVLLVSADVPGAASGHAAAHLAKPLANGALIAALRALEAVHCRNEELRRVAGMTMLDASLLD